jgi:hypothetical protein
VLKIFVELEGAREVREEVRVLRGERVGLVERVR